MPQKIDEVLSSVLKRITPRDRERSKIEALAKKLEEKVISASEAFDIEIDVRVEGSIAKDTWLSHKKDIDIFVRMPPDIPRKTLAETGLKIARKATEGYEQIERFAEHPYLEAVMDNTIVNIVPCYRVERGEWLSATDRTPFHTDYIKNRLNDELKGEVRLLKKFMMGIDTYGAEIRVGGFSGYLCELLILHFESFVNTLESFSRYERRRTIDPGAHDREVEIEGSFQDPLVMVDPVDQSRNVASAVRPRKLYTFVAAARNFLKRPGDNFFYPPEIEVLSVKELEQALSTRGSEIVAITFGGVNEVSDVLWGQIYKSKRALHRLIQHRDFKVLRDAAWSDEEKLNVLIFELEQRRISRVKNHLGPPLEKKEGCEKFLEKYLGNTRTVSGPFIEKGRWTVEIRRDQPDVVELLEETLSKGGRKIGIAEHISQRIRREFKIYVNEGITRVYRRSIDFARFFTQFLSGKPKWLKKPE